MSGLPKGELRALETKLSRAMGQCVADFGLIGAGDRVMVCVSGGKDSYALLTLLERFRRKAPIDFELLAVHLDQGQPGYDGAPLRDWLQAQRLPHRILREDTYRVVVDNVPEGKTYCSLCSRLRRGVLYNAAVELGCTKIEAILPRQGGGRWLLHHIGEHGGRLADLIACAGNLLLLHIERNGAQRAQEEQRAETANAPS